jgi:predicted NBD/HSP70 family sugar kinase
MLQTVLGVPTFVEHDARAAALWLSEQAADGSAQARASVAFLAIGTGISAGVVLDGALLRGDNSFAGEVGHVVADPDGAVCACGLRGCLETIAAGPAIGRQADEAMAAGRSTVLSPHSSAADVFRAGSAGDEVAVEIIDRVADHLARAIRSLALTLGVKASRHRRRRGGRRTCPSRSYPIAHRPRTRGLATRPGRLGRCDRRAAVANRGARRVRGGGDRSPPHRLA